MSQLNDQSMIGHPKEGLKPSPTNDYPLFHTCEIANGSKVKRYFEIYHKYSLLFFKMKAVSSDITLKLKYFGTLSAPK